MFVWVSLTWGLPCICSQESSVGLARPDIQDGFLTWVAVDTGCKLEVQLGLLTSVSTWPLYVAWASHSLVAGY